MPVAIETLTAIPRSLGLSRAFWKSVARRWTGLGLLHLHLAVGLALLPVTARVHAAYGAFARDTAPTLFAEFPKILLHDGQVLSEDATWIDPRSGEVLLVIDTTNRRPPEAREPLRVSQGALWIGAGPHAQRFSLEGLTLLIDREAMLGWVDSLRIGLAPLFYASAFVGSACWRLVLAFFVMGPAAYGWARLRGLRLGLDACVRVASLAQTPGLLVGALGLSLGASPWLWLLLASLLPLIWTIWAVEASRET